MSRRHAPSRRALLAGLVGVLAAVPVLTGCASHVDSVDPGAYLNTPNDGMYRVNDAYKQPNLPPAVVYPESCQSPPSFSGAPMDNC